MMRGADHDWILGLLAILAAAACVAVLVSLVISGVSHAKGQLTLDDFDDTGLDADLLALIDTGSLASRAWTVLYRASPAVGSLTAGELGLGSGNSALTLIEWRGETVNDLRLQNGSDLDLDSFFGTGGAGADLTLRVQTLGGTGTGALQNAGATVARWDMDANAKTILDGLSNGDRLILAFTRAGQPPAQVTGVTAAATSDTAISVSWDAAARADGYRAEWGTASGNYTGSDTTTGASYTVTGLQASTTYYVRITATRTGVGYGAPSAEAVIATPAPTPAPMLIVTVDDRVPEVGEMVTVTWTVTGAVSVAVRRNGVQVSTAHTGQRSETIADRKPITYSITAGNQSETARGELTIKPARIGSVRSFIAGGNPAGEWVTQIILSVIPGIMIIGISIFRGNVTPGAFIAGGICMPVVAFLYAALTNTAEHYWLATALLVMLVLAIVGWVQLSKS